VVVTWTPRSFFSFFSPLVGSREYRATPSRGKCGTRHADFFFFLFLFLSLDRKVRRFFLLPFWSTEIPPGLGLFSFFSPLFRRPGLRRPMARTVSTFFFSFVLGHEATFSFSLPRSFKRAWITGPALDVPSFLLSLGSTKKQLAERSVFFSSSICGQTRLEHRKIDPCFPPLSLLHSL